MKFNVIEEKENPLLKRKELLMSIDYEGASTPSKAELQKLLAEQLNANIENLEITKVLSEIGLPRGKAWIKIWEEKKIPIYAELKKKKPEQAAAPVPEQPAEQAPEEPQEEKKEEQPQQKAPQEAEQPQEQVEEKSE